MTKKLQKLLEKYPYAFVHNAWTGELYIDEVTGEPQSEDEALPIGWKKLFWQCMKDLRKPLQKANLLNTFYFVQVKQKYGTMRLYNNGATQEVLDIIDKYEYLSQYVCEECGEPAEYYTTGWIGSFCLKCVQKCKINSGRKKIKQPTPLVYTQTIYKPEENITVKVDCTKIWNKLYKTGVKHD